MASRVVMPKLTDTMEEGVVLAWKKREGDAVGAGDVLAEIETDKAVMDLEAFASGTLRRILVREGETVKAGALIAVIGEPDEDIAPLLAEAGSPASTPRGEAPAVSAAAPPSAPARPPAPTAREAPTAGPMPTAGSAIKASPRARSLAAEHGIDLATVRGTGPDGRIIEQDVLAVAKARAPVGQDRPLGQMRKAIARITTQSKAPVPHFYVTTEIAMEAAERLRHQLKQARQFTPSITDLIVKAAALAIGRYPEINVSYAGDALRLHPTIDIGIAVALDDGLLLPVVRDCGAKSLARISAEARDLIERARTRRLKPEEYTGATFSVSNLGMFDVENFIAVLMPPEAAALAIGSVRDVPVVEDGRVTVGRRMKVTLSCDHRALDGAQAARFLREFKRVLEHPLELVLPESMQ
ncbi:dihydrolipoamide acetyltransferase family protein [Nitrospira sp. Kam-Ns4a]